MAGMTDLHRLRRAFLAFQVILGLALFWGSMYTVVDAGAADLHARIIGSAEALGALAFLLPRTRRVGAAMLLVTIALAFLVHGARGEWRPDLLVYAAGVLLVAVHDGVRLPLPEPE
jgi:uncharacterized membrane protein YphA (DoxX/SURF4 family)